jgi:hypothetical protein
MSAAVGTDTNKQIRGLKDVLMHSGTCFGNSEVMLLISSLSWSSTPAPSSD